jgi:hypothetical protein
MEGCAGGGQGSKKAVAQVMMMICIWSFEPNSVCYIYIGFSNNE